ncbi:MAG: hypothetical protein RIS75_930, partial [Actinomycetota bacterium]
MKATFRIILASAIAALFLFSTTPAQADSGERISDYLVDVEITADGRTLITEEITYDFGYSDKHGIFRSIPMWDDLPNDLRRTYDVTIDSVLMDGNAVVVEEIEEDPFLTLKIGSPDFTVSGTHTYEISYVISNALTVLTQKDVDAIPNNTEVKAGDVEFYWDVIGSEWQVPIDSAVISISTKSAPLIRDCYAETECTRETGPTYTTFSVV